MPHISELTNDLLLDIFSRDNLDGKDLASIESACYSFRRPAFRFPNRFSSIVETAARICALQKCASLSYLPESKLAEVFNNCNGCWKQVQRFARALDVAFGHNKQMKQWCQVEANYYFTMALNDKQELFCMGKSAWGQNQIKLDSNQKIKSMSVGISHCLFLSSSGEVYILTDDSVLVIPKARLEKSLDGIKCKQIAVGSKHSLFLTVDGKVYAHGNGSFGQLGLGDRNDQSEAIPISTLNLHCRISHVTAGANHSLAVTETGVVYSWGCADNGRLGHYAQNDLIPCEIAFFQNVNSFILRVFAGETQSAAIDSNGKLYTWGAGYCGCLGHGEEYDEPLPRLVSSLTNFRVVQVSMRKRKTLALTDDGKVYGFGWQGIGSLGMDDSLPNLEKIMTPRLVDVLNDVRVVQLSTGWYHTALITDEGKLLGFGDSSENQLGCNSSVIQSPLDLSERIASFGRFHF